MKKIASHNSGTGEKSKNFFHSLLVPFCRCQNLSLEEQYELGVTYFDIRIKKIDDEYVLAHGLWLSELSFHDVLERLTDIGRKDIKKIYVSVTYEGRLDDEWEREHFVDYVSDVVAGYKGIELTTINVKKPTWTTLKTYEDIPFNQCFTAITGWKRLIPIPLFWFLQEDQDRDFDNVKYKMVDFFGWQII